MLTGGLGLEVVSGRSLGLLRISKAELHNARQMERAKHVLKELDVRHGNDLKRLRPMTS